MRVLQQGESRLILREWKDLPLVGEPQYRLDLLSLSLAGLTKVCVFGVPVSALKNILWLIITLISVILAVCLVMDNQDLIFFKIFDFESKLFPKGLLLLVSFSIGCLVTLMLSSSIIITQKFKLNSAQNSLIKLKSVSNNKESG